MRKEGHGVKIIRCVDVTQFDAIYPIREKEKVLAHMKAGENYCASARSVKDRTTGKMTGIEDNWKTDGVYCWSADAEYRTYWGRYAQS